LSSETSSTAYYEVPNNLQINPLNENVTLVTLNDVRTQYASACQNVKGFKGNVIGVNNTRDLGDLYPYSTALIQHSAAVPISAMFLRNKQLNLWDSLDYNADQYEQFKELMIQTAYNNEYFGMTTSQVLDSIIATITVGKIPASSFYWSDQLPATTYQQTTYTWYTGTSTTFATIQTYNFDAANYRAILIYINNGTTQLIYNRDYFITPGIAQVTINPAVLTSGISIEIREYSTTYGTYAPATPTKLGLYPRFLPEVYLDTTYFDF
jgi:hypothetical protein